MIINPVNEEWLSDVLAGMGSTSDEVAVTLRAARVTGEPRFGRRCPVAAYVGIKAKARVPPAWQMLVWISSEKATVRDQQPRRCGSDPRQCASADTGGHLCRRLRMMDGSTPTSPTSTARAGERNTRGNPRWAKGPATDQDVRTGNPRGSSSSRSTWGGCASLSAESARVTYTPPHRGGPAPPWGRSAPSLSPGGLFRLRTGP